MLSDLSPRATQFVQWGALFLALLVAIYAATQSRDAPLLILFIALYTILANFSIPVPPTREGFVPLVSVTSLLLLPWEPALLALAAGLLLAELTAPLWEPLWQDMPGMPQKGRSRVGLALVPLFALLLVGLIGGQAGGGWTSLLETLPAGLEQFLAVSFWRPLVVFGLIYFLVYAVAHLALARFRGQSWTGLFREHLPRLLLYAFFLQPLAWLGVIVYRRWGLPAFVFMALGLVVLALQLWFAWRSRISLRRQQVQFASLNRISAQLRETLDLPEVLARTFEQVSSVLPLDRFAVVLRNEDGLSRPFFYADGRSTLALDVPFEPDDFTRWVLDHGRELEVDSSALFYAERHRLAPPQPLPSLWAGYPLLQGNRCRGVLIIHQTTPARVIDPWSRELLVAITRQASDAIENARQHRETLRLYSLTDQALARRARQLQAILNSTREGFIMLDTAGRVVLANPVAESFWRLMNPEGGDLYGSEAAVTQLGYAPEEQAELLRRLAAGEIPPSRTEVISLTGPEGERRHIERLGTPVRGLEERPLGWLLVLRDVTEAQEQAEWRSQFTNMIVHDLRNPLTTLLTGFERLERQQRAPDPERVDVLLDSGRRVTLNMLDMVDSLMDIARMEAGQIIADAEAMRLPPLVRRVMNDMLPLAHIKKVELAFSYPDDLPAVWGDEELVRRVLVNLLDNALKFTPAGGRIHGFLGEEPPRRPGDEPGVRCTVIDSGPGIPEAARGQIFERFVRIAAGGGQVRGTGVGLTFCKMAIEAQEGEIWVEEAPGGGSCFAFTLPGIPDFGGQQLLADS